MVLSSPAIELRLLLQQHQKVFSWVGRNGWLAGVSELVLVLGHRHNLLVHTVFQVAVSSPPSGRMHRLLLCAVLLFVLHAAAAGNMNGRAGQYKIANNNPSSPKSFSTDYAAEHFDVYSPLIESRYSEVFWTMMDFVELPDAIQKRFDKQVMAVVGFEVDQVRDTPSGEVSVPITWAYNHHFVAYLTGKNTELVRTETGSSHAKYAGLDHGTGFHWEPRLLDEDEGLSDVPLTQGFAEANGGEFRLSYHGYPAGYAQLIESPARFHLQPMQIDTWNREMTDGAFKAGPLPRSSRAPQDQGYSGLLECPCSDRLPKAFGERYALQGAVSCQGPVETAAACFTGARQVVQGGMYSERTVHDAAQLEGCSLLQHTDGTIDITWNTAPSRIHSQTGAASKTVAFTEAMVNVTVSLLAEEGPDAVVITIVGPADRWFGVGFGASSMCLNQQSEECPVGGPYAIIVSGEGEQGVVERKLDYHGPGHTVAASVKVQSNSAVDGNRTVVVTRALKGASASHFSFSPDAKSIPVITARGCGLTFAQHCGHGPSLLNFLAANQPTTVCDAGMEGTIGGQAFPRKRCAPFPRSDLLDQHNPTCSIESYVGGIKCCRHGMSLLDQAQSIPWPDQTLRYRLKFRFYFEEYRPATAPGTPASHQQLVRLYTQTEAHAGEYDIEACPAGTPPSQCVQTITSRFTVRDLALACGTRRGPWCAGKEAVDASRTAGIKLIYAGPHCHAPSCISMELYNADTGQLLCRVEPVVGRGADADFDEPGFLAIPPCLWGDPAEGLQAPSVLDLDTRLLSIKRNNNTWAHTGEMASWQMRGVVVPKKPAAAAPQPVVVRASS